jgi:hypothetical protein
MSDQIDRETKTEEVVPTPNSSVRGYKVSEQSTTRVNNDSSSAGIILGILLTLGLGVGAAAYFMNNNRITPTIVVPGATNTIKDNKSTVIERNTTKEVTPATPQVAPAAPAAPRVEVNVPVINTPPQPPQIVNPAPVNPPPSVAPAPSLNTSGN